MFLHYRKQTFNVTCIIITAVTLVSALILPPCQSFAQEKPKLKDIAKVEEQEPEKGITEKPKIIKPAGPDDEFGRGTPHGTVKGFLKATGESEYERAIQYLDLRNLPRGIKKSDGPELARKLKIILDRSLWIDMDLVSDSPQGHADDELPGYRDVLGVIETEGGTFNILLQKVPRGDGVSVWKFSNVTVAQIPEIYDHVGYGRLGEAIYTIFPDVEFFGAKLWQWVGFVIIMIVAYLVVLPPTWITAYILRKIGTAICNWVARFVAGPFRFLLWILIVKGSFDLVSPTITMRAILQSQALLIIAAAWIIIRVNDFLIDHKAERLKAIGRVGAAMLLQPLKNISRTLLTIIAALVLLDNIGFKVTTIIAGLGVGGVAVALAAQKTIEDLIGAFTLISSQPVRIGEFCRFGNTLGTVEEIRIRSTRIRTLENTIVSIPNAEFSKLEIENFTKREKIWFHPRISLRFETKQSQIRTVISDVEKLLRTHTKVFSDSVSVRFTEISAYSFDLEVFAYVDTNDYGTYQKIAEELNFQIMDVVEKAGAKFARPSQSLYVETGAESDNTFSSEGEEKGKGKRGTQ